MSQAVFTISMYMLALHQIVEVDHCSPHQVVLSCYICKQKATVPMVPYYATPFMLALHHDTD